MKPIFISHETYQDSILLRLRQHYSGGVFVIVNKDWPLVEKFWMTDLSYITTLLQDEYATKGPEPRDPAYNRRTSIERSNKREKNDYKLESGRHRSTKMWYVRIYGIMICQHMDAWFSHGKESLADLKTLILPQTA